MSFSLQIQSKNCSILSKIVCYPSIPSRLGAFWASNCLEKIAAALVEDSITFKSVYGDIIVEGFVKEFQEIVLNIRHEEERQESEIEGDLVTISSNFGALKSKLMELGRIHFSLNSRKSLEELLSFVLTSVDNKSSRNKLLAYLAEFGERLERDDFLSLSGERKSCSWSFMEGMDPKSFAHHRVCLSFFPISLFHRPCASKASISQQSKS